MQRETIRIKIMSYNIRHGRGMDDCVDLERIAEVVRQSGADIVGLQEADEHWSERSSYEDQTRWLAERLGMEYVFGGSINWDPIPQSRGFRRKHGVTVLSKYPITQSRQHLFSTCVGNHRELLETELNVHGCPLYFYSTHWGLDVEERMIQSNETIRWINERNGSRIVVGDFNATPDSPEIVQLFQHFHAAGTIGGPAMNTFPADVPIKRIDYIMGSKEVQFKKADVIFTLASDHLPIVCEAEFPR